MLAGWKSTLPIFFEILAWGKLYLAYFF